MINKKMTILDFCAKNIVVLEKNSIFVDFSILP